LRDFHQRCLRERPGSELQFRVGVRSMGISIVLVLVLELAPDAPFGPSLEIS
jgi:hypothetical protein